MVFMQSVLMLCYFHPHFFVVSVSETFHAFERVYGMQAVRQRFLQDHRCGR
jgi:hypothetical protein